MYKTVDPPLLSGPFTLKRKDDACVNELCLYRNPLYI